MTAMLDRIAEALEKHVDAQGQFSGIAYRDLAIVALETMMEPDSAMLHAAAKAMSPSERPTPERVSVQQKHRIRYRAMIRKALEAKFFAPPQPTTKGTIDDNG